MLLPVFTQLDDSWPSDDDVTEAEAPVRSRVSKPMRPSEFRGLVKLMLSDAQQLAENETQDARTTASSAYSAEAYGNETEGRSNVLTQEVYETIQSLLPPALRVIHGPEHVVEFIPTNGDSVEAAKQQTDYVRYIYEQDNPGFRLTYGFLKDFLIRNLCAAKWGYDSRSDLATVFESKGLSDEEIAALLEDTDVEILDFGVSEKTADQPLVDVTYRKLAASGRVKIYPLPPEEFLYNRTATSIEDATCVAHTTKLRRSEILALGVEEEDLEELGSGDNAVQSIEAAQRQPRAVNGDPGAKGANALYRYTEAYVRLDRDGDGIAELLFVPCLGNDFAPVEYLIRPVDHVPMAYATPDPEPNAFLGEQSVANRVEDIQRIDTQMTRGMLDSLARSLDPDTVVVESQVSISDLLSPELGKIIRTDAPGMVQEMNHEFTGQSVLPVFGYMQDTLERRTGVEKGVAGLDADSLQSSTQEGVSAAITGSQQRQEMLIRLFLEMFFKPMMRGLNRTTIQNPDVARIVQMRGRFVTIDPRPWNADLDMRVTAGFGMLQVRQKIATLVGIKTQQEQIMATLGPDNPLCSLAQYSHTLREITTLSGFADPSQFFNEITGPVQMPPPPPNPDMMRVQAGIQNDQQKLMLDVQKAQADVQLGKYKIDRESETKLLELRAWVSIELAKNATKANTDALETTVWANVERERTHMDHHAEIHGIDLERRMSTGTGADA